MNIFDEILSDIDKCSFDDGWANNREYVEQAKQSVMELKEHCKSDFSREGNTNIPSSMYWQGYTRALKDILELETE